MNKSQQTCIEAYLKLFNGTAFDQPLFQETNVGATVGIRGTIIAKNKAVKQKDVNEDNEQIYMIFTHNIDYAENGKEYDFGSYLEFRNLSKKFVSSLFGQFNYNYDIINQVINDYFKMGQEHALFDSLKPVKDPAIHHYFKKAYQFKGTSQKLVSTETKISEINFSDFFKTKSNSQNGKLRSRRITIYYNLVVKDGEIHPIAIIVLPISISDNMRIIVDIHPEGQSLNEIKINEGMLKLDIVLKERIDMILRKELKLKNTYLATLSFEDKLNYLKVAEMSMI